MDYWQSIKEMKDVITFQGCILAGDFNLLLGAEEEMQLEILSGKKIGRSDARVGSHGC
jgi:hypothetical protein